MENGLTGNLRVRLDQTRRRFNMVEESIGSMPIRVELNPILRKKYRPDYDPAKGLILSEATGKTLHQVVQELGIPPDEVSSILVNHHVEESTYIVQEDDLIHLSIAISGG